jgi:hypothetical protein
MMTIGDILIRDGLISRQQLAEAFRLQEMKDGQLANMLIRLGVVTRDQINAAWMQAYVFSPLEEAIDRACANQFSRCEKRDIIFDKAVRSHTISEDLLEHGNVSGQETHVQGQARLSINGRESLPLQFTVEIDNGFAILDDPSEIMVRRWVPLVLRQTGGANAA